ncbi:hypothetical protein [Mastigocladopsis repens]|uniref:hypothetical protein n=1 Tax=Mastigocladopsis repens TaxID=221287 RepID=UPI0003656AD4|nr:hypothetical protein [Mastigocladopsis repens]
MPKVVVIVASGEREMTNPTLSRMLSAIETAIAEDSKQATSVEVVAADQLILKDYILEFNPLGWQISESQEMIFCPLTLSLPENVVLPFTGIIKACREVLRLRQQLAQQIQVAIGDGCFWLPVVLTAKGPLYGEVIALAEEFYGKLPENLLLLCDLTYYQPFHLSDALRQPLYQMAHNILESLLAPPAVYLMQFGLQRSEICFDRLWPFPTAPALASVGIQQPDLFTSHWYCLTAKPILDLTIIPTAE